MARIVDVPPAQLNSIAVVGRWPDGRVKTITAGGSSFTVTLNGREFYARALRVLGYKVIPSTLFDVTRDDQGFSLVGHGVGHGVGMCQWGARGRAEAGMSAAQIIQAYFPGTRLR
jgi:stage II sporulation protein D